MNIGKLEGIILSSLDAERLLQEIGYRLDTLQKKDDRWKCFCPIHKERIFRSLTVDVATARFSCGYNQCPGSRGGDYLTLFAAAKGISRKEAIRLWAAKMGLPEPDDEPAQGESGAGETPAAPDIGGPAEPELRIGAAVGDYPPPTGLPHLPEEESQPEEEPPPAEILTARGYLARFHHLRSLGTAQEAGALLEEALERYPDDLDLLDATAEFCAAESNPVGAHEALVRLAAAYHQQGSREGELRALERALALDPNDHTTRMTMVELCTAQGMAREAVRCLYEGTALLEASGQTEEALSCYRRITELDSTEARAFQRLAEIHIDRKDYATASGAILALARLYEEREVLDKACDAYRQLIGLAPGNVDARRELARLFLARGKRDEAAEVLLQLADVLVAEDRREEAAEALGSVAEHRPEDLSIRERLAELYEGLGRAGEAIDAFLIIGSTADQEGDVPRAIAAWTKVHQGRPDERDVLERLVKLLLQQDRKTEAKELLCRQVQFELAQGEGRHAARWLRALLDLEPHDTDTAIALAHQLRQDGNEEELLSFIRSHTQFLAASASADQAFQLLEALPLEVAEMEAVRAVRDSLQAVVPPEKPTAERSLESAQRALGEGLYEEARRLFQEARQLGADPLPCLTGLFRTAVSAKNAADVAPVLPELFSTLEAQANNEEAVRLALEVVDQFPDHENLRRPSFAFLRKTGRQQDLISCLAGRLSADPGDPRAVLELADVYIEIGDATRALAVLDAAVEHCLQQGHPESAGKIVRRAIAIDPEDEGRHAALAESLTRTGRNEEAAEVLVSLGRHRRSQGRIPEAGHLLGRALAFSPSNLPALKEDFEASVESKDDDWVRRSARRLAKAYAASDLHGKAVETLGRARRLLPRDPALLEEALAVYEEMGAVDRAVESVLELIGTHRESGRDEEVLMLCQRGLALSPTNLSLWEELAATEEKVRGLAACEATLVRLAGVYRDKGLNGKRLDVLARLREAFPQSARVWNLSLEALEETGDRSEVAAVLTAQARYLRNDGDVGAARETLRRALEIDPDNVEVLRDLADASLAMGDVEGAATSLGSLCEQLHSDPPPTEPATVDLLVDAYRRILELAPELTQPRLRLASLLFENQRRDEAAALYRELAATGRFDLTRDERQEVLERLAELEPSDVLVLRELALIYRDRGDRDHEIECLEAVADQATATERWEPAIEALARLAQFMPGEPERWTRLAEALDHAGRGDVALDALGKAATIYLQRGDARAAEPLLCRLAETGTDSPEILAPLARAAERNGRAAEAAQYLVRLAGILLQSGEAEGAGENLRHACELQPHRREYKGKLLDALAQQKSYRRAVGMALSLVASAQEEEERLRILGKVLAWQAEDPELLEAVIPAFDRLYPGREGIRLLVNFLNRAEMLSAKDGLAPAAVNVPEKFLHSPQFWEAFLATQGRCLSAACYVQGVTSLAEQNSYDQARAICERGLEVHGDVRSLLEHYLTILGCLEAKPEEQLPVLERLLAVCEQSGDRDGVSRTRKIIRAMGGGGELTEEEISEEVAESRERARRYAEAGSPHDSIVEWKKVLEGIPGDPEALEALWELSARIGDMGAARQAGHQLAEAACLRGDTEEGIRWFERILDRIPSDLEICQRLAELCLGLGRREEGIEYVRRLARIYAERGEEEEELRVLERLRLLEPDDADLERLAGLYEETDRERALEIHRTILERAERAKDVPRASASALAIVRLAGGGGDALRGLAMRFEHLGEHQRARGAYLEAAEWFRREGEGMKALDCYRGAQRLGERNPDLALTMAGIYQDFGNLLEAEACLWQAWEALEVEGEGQDLLQLAHRILALRTENLPGYARAVAYLDRVADRLAASDLAEVRREFLAALARHPSSPRTREILDDVSGRWSGDEAIEIGILVTLGDLLRETGSPGATRCWLAVAGRAWEAGDEKVGRQALNTLRELELSPDERDTVIALWSEHGSADEVLPEMLAQVETLRRLGRFEAALEVNRRILEVTPESERAWSTLPELLDRCGDPAAACDARLELARRLLRAGQQEEAVRCGRELLAQPGAGPELLEGVKALFAEAAYTEGLLEVGRRQVEVRIEEGRYELAMGELEELRGLVGESPGLFGKMAEVARLQGDRARERDFRRAGARAFAAQEDFGRAVENYRALLDQDSEAVELRLDLADLLWGRGFPEDAKREHAQAVDALLQQERWEEARRAADALLERAPMDLTVLESAVRWAEHDDEPDRHRELLRRWAARLAERGDRERAVTVYRDLLTWSPDDLAVRQNLVDLLQGLGRTQEAAQELLGLAQAAREQGDQSRTAWAAEGAWRMNPESREASTLVAQMAEEGEQVDTEVVAGAFAALAHGAVVAGDLDEADTWVAKGKELGVPAGTFAEVRAAAEQRRTGPVASEEVDDLVLRADAAYEAGDLASGRALYEAAVAQSPSDLILLARFAQLLVRTGQAEVAFRLLEQKAEILERTDDYEGASYCLEQLVQLRPERADPLLRLGRLQTLARDEQAAWNSISRAIDLALAAEVTREEQERVAAAMRDCLARLPDRPEVWERVFELETELGHHGEALAALKSIHRLAHQSGRTLEAVESLQRAVSIYPVSLPREEWRAPYDWAENDASLRWTPKDQVETERPADPEHIRNHLRQRLELATYHLRHGFQDAGTRELVVAGEIARISGLWKQARRFYQESLKWLKHLGERTGQRAVWHGLLSVSLALGETDTARRTVRSWAAWEEERGELERALEVRRSYLESEPRDLSIREDLVARAWEWGYGEMGWEEGLILAKHLQEKDLFGRAEALYRGLIQRSKEPRFAAELAGRAAEAREPLLRLLRDRGDHAAVADLERAEGEEAKAAGDYARAAQLFGQALAQRPQDIALLEELIACLQQAGDDEAALNRQVELACLYRSSGMIQKAIEVGGLVVHARAENEEALAFLTACYREAGDLPRACAFYWQLVNTLNQEGRLQAAAPVLGQIEELAQRAPENWALLAQSWTELDRSERAGQAYHRAGAAAAAEGDLEEARVNMEKAAALLSDDAEVRESLERITEELGRRGQAGRRGELLAAVEDARRRGERAEACRRLDDYLNEFPDDVAAKEKLVELLAGLTGRAEDFAGATAALTARQRERLLRLSEALANHYLSAGETGRAVRFIRMTVDLAPERLDLQRSLMDHYAALGLHSEAARQGLELAARQAKAGNHSAAVSVYRDLLRVDPSNVEARNALAVELIQGGHPDEARREFQELAETYARQDLLGKAIASLQSAVSLDPENEALRERLAELYALKGDTGAALGELKVVEGARRERGELEKAAAILTAMVRLDPERGSIRERLAETYLALGDRRRALETYQGLAHLYRERELPGRMLDAAEKAMALDGENLELSRMIVEAYRDRGDLKMALAEAHRMAGLIIQRSMPDGERLYREILEWEPEDAESIQALAQCCERQRRNSDASDHYEHLGRIYQAQARFLEATRMWARALELNNRKVALKEELAEVFLDLGDEYHGHLLLEELAEHYENLGDYDEAVNRWLRLADRHIQKAMELPA